MSDDFDTMLNIDPLAEAEKLTGHSYKEDGTTMALGFAMAMTHNAEKQIELELRDDTHHSMSWANLLRILADLGFRAVYRREFTDDQYGEQTHETFAVLWRSDGILAKAESYRGSVNTVDLYYNWRPNEDVNSWGLTSSGHFHRESYDIGERIWIGSHDVREALRHTLSRLEANGSFVTPWIERPFLWLLDYMQPKIEGYDYRAITESVIAELPEHVRQAITPEVL